MFLLKTNLPQPFVAVEIAIEISHTVSINVIETAKQLRSLHLCTGNTKDVKF